MRQLLPSAGRPDDTHTVRHQRHATADDQYGTRDHSQTAADQSEHDAEHSTAHSDPVPVPVLEDVRPGKRSKR